MQSKTKLVTVVKQRGKLTNMKAYTSHVCKSWKRGWNIPSYYNIDSKSTKKDHQIYSKKLLDIKIGSAFSYYLKHNSKRMKINCPSISTERAVNWYHNYLTLDTYVSKRQWDQICDRLERDRIPSGHNTNLVSLANTRDTAKSMVLHRY